MYDKVLEHTGSVPLIGAPPVWLTGAAGLGDNIRVGIIDTGIDYHHLNFGGPGTNYGANNTSIIGDVPYFPGTKVVGGYDFAGDGYDAGGTGSALIPQPDPDPMDCQGHGSHVAGTVGGYGVTASHATYAGPWNTTTNFNALFIGPGVAPQCDLYALRVFGCAGSTNLVVPAIEWAMDPNGDDVLTDHLDVINMSLGSPFGLDEDPDCIAANNAAAAGVIVVCSAGNSGDLYYITGSPGTARRAISTAASVDARTVFSAFRIEAPAGIAGQYLCARALFGPSYGDVFLTGTVAYPATQGNGCAAFDSTNAALINGKIALLDRGSCTFKTKVRNAELAGAIGVIIANNVATDPFDMGNDSNVPAVSIPSIMVSQATGNLIKSNLASGVQVFFDGSLLNSYKNDRVEDIDTLGTFSSRGASAGGDLLKPDIAAPGVSIFSTAHGTGYQGASFNGTSMASPHVAGAAAVLRARNTTWTVEQLKALLMNTAAHDLFQGPNFTPPRYGVGRVGAGRLDLEKAAQSSLIMYDANGNGAVSVSFGELEIVNSVTLQRQVRVENLGPAPMQVTPSYDPITDIPGVGILLSPSTPFVVPAGGSTTLTVQLNANPALMKNSRDATVAATQNSTPRHWVSEESGLLKLTPTSGPELRLPVYAAARPASAMASDRTMLLLDNKTGVETLNLVGTGVNTGASPPNDIQSLVHFSELQEISPNDPDTTGEQDLADLKYVGVTTDYPARVAAGEGVANSLIYFAFATHGDWTSLNQVSFNVEFYTDGDSTPDYWTYSESRGTIFGLSRDDVPYNVIWKLSDWSGVLGGPINYYSPSSWHTALYNSNVCVLTVPASAIGLNAGSSSFRYRVYTTNAYRDGEVDSTPLRSYNVARPGLDFTNGAVGVPTYLDKPGNAIPVRYDRNAFLDAGSKGILLLHHHNTRGSRAEVIRVDALDAWREDDFPTNKLFPPGSTDGWSSFGFNSPLGSAMYHAATGAYRGYVAADNTRFRISGVMGNFNEWLLYSQIGPNKIVRAKYYMYAGGMANPSDLNQIPNMRMRLSNRFAVNSMLEVFHHTNDDPVQTAMDQELRPSTVPTSPSVYRLDFDPIDAPTLVNNSASEGVLRAFETYSIHPQDNGYVAMTESVIGTYPATALPVTQPPAKTYDPLDLILYNSAELTLMNLIPGAEEGQFGSPDFSTPQPTYSEAGGLVTMSTVNVPTDRIGIASREFNPDRNTNNYASRIRVAPDSLYQIRWHLTSTQQVNRQAQIRLRARSIKFAWSQKLEIGGAWGTGGAGLYPLNRNNAIAQESLPGIGTQNPDKYTTDTQGGWYTLIMNTPMSPDIRPEFPPGTPLSTSMPNIAAQPGPGVNTRSRRDIFLGLDLVDSISGGAGRNLEEGQVTLDRVEIRAFPNVPD
ncbi:MAG: S8 family serine peptidase [Candidatus Sumerlaeaceae bacterium]|nr:S8 family serine peptidase [Candidatus Sumerlaeaceae bacterium]